MAVRNVRIGGVLRLSREKIEVDPAAEYRQIGVYSWGKGLILRPKQPGASLSKLTYYRLTPNALILSNIQAWEAAIATSDGGAGEYIASQRFLPYLPIDEDEVSVAYVLQFLLSDPGMVLVRKASPGSVTRNRTLGIAAFENIEIPLPRIDEQRQIAARLDGLRDAVDQVDRTGDAAIAAVDRIEAELISGLLGDEVPFSEFVEINPSPERVSPETNVVFAPMAALSVSDGALLGAEVRQRSEVGAGYKQFSRGDIVFARITPSMQNGKSAIFADPQHRIGYGTSEFHVLRAKSPELTTAIHALVRSTWFKSLALRTFTGTAGQQRVPAAFLRNVLVPNIEDGRVRHSVENLKDLEDDRWRLRGLAKRRRELAAALPKAVRNEIFSKLV
ncbi:MAG: hypothetical protein JWR71_1038 [Pseudarthrobacter sp.]|nr:hypothetical protein [Pseudarthrobacter sp.]